MELKVGFYMLVVQVSRAARSWSTGCRSSAILSA